MRRTARELLSGKPTGQSPLLWLMAVAAVALAGCGGEPVRPDASQPPVTDGRPAPADARPAADAATGECAGKPDEAPCGDGTDTECDNPDICLQGRCVTNREPATTACGERTNDACNAADTCDGAGNCLSNHAPSGAPCGELSGDACSAADTCDGAGACLANHQPAGTPCGDTGSTECSASDTCNGLGVCVANHQPIGTPCGSTSNTDCLNPDICNGVGACVANDPGDGTICNDCPLGPGLCAKCMSGECPDACDLLSFTPYRGTNNRNDGIMFDIRTSRAARIRSFAVVLATGTWTVEVWHRPGTHVGNQGSKNGWTRAGAATVTSAGTLQATQIPVLANIDMLAGQTYGFYITTVDSGGGTSSMHNLATSVTAGEPYLSDGPLTITHGMSVAYQFGSATDQRVLSGTVYYSEAPYCP